ncbi:MAG: winged helix-turn-helix domain-containing protein [Phycicoccus sp.]|nr:winged helix-turn-helix domain-containing protein [Phycicoccus sp.]
MATYANYDDGWNIWTSHATLALASGASRESVRRSIAVLATEGWIENVGTKPSGVLERRLTIPAEWAPQAPTGGLTLRGEGPHTEVGGPHTEVGGPHTDAQPIQVPGQKTDSGTPTGVPTLDPTDPWAAVEKAPRPKPPRAREPEPIPPRVDPWAGIE